MSFDSSMEQAREDLALELASGTPNYTNSVAGAIRYCPLIAHVLRSLEKAVRCTWYLICRNCCRCGRHAPFIKFRAQAEGMPNWRLQ